MAETPSGMLNAVGLQKKGVDYFVNNIYNMVKGYGSNLVVNVSGSQPEDYAEVARRLAPLDGVKAIEVNISCPNVKQGGMAFGTTCAGAEAVTKAVRQAWPRTLIVKLSPNVESISVNAVAAANGGADCLSLINTLTGMAVDIEKRRPIIANNTGGVSGAGIKPVALKMVYDASHAVKIPVIGMGGITCGTDAIEFLMAGARAVQVGTANFTDVNAMPRIIKEMGAWLDAHGINDVNEIVDTLVLN